MELNNRTARIAGLVYLIVVVAGIFSLLYVPSQIFVRGDSLGTVDNIMEFESLYRLGIAVSMISSIAFLLLPLLLYKLLHQVHRDAATLMVMFAVVGGVTTLVSEVNWLNALSLLSGAEYLHAFTADQLNAQVMLTFKAFNNGILVSKVFWGLWLLPFGYLVFKSSCLPRVLGILLMVGSIGYLIDAFGPVLFPVYGQTAISRFAVLPSALGEVGICLWLLIMGARTTTYAASRHIGAKQ